MSFYMEIYFTKYFHTPNFRCSEEPCVGSKAGIAILQMKKQRLGALKGLI